MPASKFPNLFSPLTIRGKKYRNRIITGPTLFAHAIYIDGITENVYRMCENRSKGGAAEVSTGEICINFEEGICGFVKKPLALVPGGKVDYTKHEGEQFEQFKEYAERINKYGAVSLLEFCHEGSQALAESPFVPYGPDEYIREDGVRVYAMTPDIMKKICDDFATGALFAKACGFDGVLIHGGHGFLFQQWVSPLTNHRTDEFGGAIENRAKFPIMVLDAVRAAVGEDFIIEVRMSAEDGVSGGMTIDDCAKFCSLIDGKCDIIHVSNGLKWKGNETYTFTDSYDEHGYNVRFAEKIKKAVKKSKVAVIGGINSPEFAEKIIAEGKVDFVVLGRQAYAEPEFANKARDGHEELIRRCIRCFKCYPGSIECDDDPVLTMTEEEKGAIFTPAAMGRCSINPNSGFGYYEDRLPTPKGSRRVLVIGGGVGGMQAAITAKRRGHDVLLCEKNNELGGVLLFTKIDSDKIDIWNFITTLKKEIEYLKIPVELNKTVDADFIKKYCPDAVIIAAGAHPSVPDVKDVEYAIDALKVYSEPEKIGQHVVLIGAGLTGCEVGLYLATCGKNVTVVGRRNIIAKESICMHRFALKRELEKRNVKTITSAPVKEIRADGVVYEKDGREHFVGADTIVYTMGMTPNNTDELVKACENCDSYIIGDCLKPGQIGDAVRAGYDAAMKIL